MSMYWGFASLARERIPLRTLTFFVIFLCPDYFFYTGVFEEQYEECDDSPKFDVIYFFIHRCFEFFDIFFCSDICFDVCCEVFQF